MGAMTAEVKESGVDLSALVKQIPRMRYRLLGAIGSDVARDLFTNYLQGQYGITYRSFRLNKNKYPVDRLGRRLVSYTVGKSGRATYISSYPMNLFERGRGLRSGDAESGHFILQRYYMKGWDSSSASYLAWERIIKDSLKEAEI
jgi:hypothetical protein